MKRIWLYKVELFLNHFFGEHTNTLYKSEQKTIWRNCRFFQSNLWEPARQSLSYVH